MTKLELISTTEVRPGSFSLTARVTVALTPLLKTLQANNVPTVAFDTDSAVGTAESISDEKTKALAIYSDLLGRVESLIKVGVGKAEVNPSIPAAADSAWLSVPMTFFVNPDALQEWRTKFRLIADRHAHLLIAPRRKPLSDGHTFPFLDVSHNILQSFLFQSPPSGQLGVAACFPTGSSPTFTTGLSSTSGIRVECYGRIFVPSNPRVSQCTLNQSCGRNQPGSSPVTLAVEFLDSNEQTVRVVQAQLPNFPAIPVEQSSNVPRAGKSEFFNYSVGGQTLFFETNGSAGRIPFGDTIVFPPAGSRISTLLNVLLPNEMIGRIASMRAAIKKTP
jgi:hypothetical protein